MSLKVICLFDRVILALFGMIKQMERLYSIWLSSKMFLLRRSLKKSALWSPAGDEKRTLNHQLVGI